MVHGQHVPLCTPSLLRGSCIAPAFVRLLLQRIYSRSEPDIWRYINLLLLRIFSDDSTFLLTVQHGSELSLLFGPVPTPVENDFANQMLDFYINFINDLNPGGMQLPHK